MDVHVVEPPDTKLAAAPVDADIAAAEPSVELPSPVSEEVPLLSVEIRDVAQRRAAPYVPPLK